MHIAFVLETFYPIHRAGTENYVYNLAKKLIENNHKVSVVIANVGKQTEYYNFEEIKVYALEVPQKISTAELNGLKEPSNLKEFSTLLQQLQPDLVHFHSLSRSMHAEHIKVAKQLGMKTVFTAHLGGNFCVNGDFLYLQKDNCNLVINKSKCLWCFIKKNKKTNIVFSKLFSIIINILLNTPLKKKFSSLNIVKNKVYQLELIKKYSDTNIAIAPWIKKCFEINNFKSIILVNQGINNLFVNNSNLYEIKKTIELIFIGRMHPDKGLHLLIEALKEFKDKFNLTVITIPSKDEKNYYEEIKKEFYKLGYTYWFENLTQNKVSKELAKSNLLVLPSIKNEAAPLVVLEAFAQKVPVLASSYIAFNDMIIENNNGFIFENNCINSLKEKLKFISQNPEHLKQLSENIKTPRTFDDVYNEMIFIYNKLINHHIKNEL